MKAQKSDLIREAQSRIQDAIEILEIACEGDANAEAYMIDQLKILASSNHGFLSSNLNLDELAERYEGEEVESPDYFKFMLD